MFRHLNHRSSSIKIRLYKACYAEKMQIELKVTKYEIDVCQHFKHKKSDKNKSV